MTCVANIAVAAQILHLYIGTVNAGHRSETAAINRGYCNSRSTWLRLTASVYC